MITIYATSHSFPSRMIEFSSKQESLWILYHPLYWTLCDMWQTAFGSKILSIVMVCIPCIVYRLLSIIYHILCTIYHLSIIYLPLIYHRSILSSCRLWSISPFSTNPPSNIPWWYLYASSSNRFCQFQFEEMGFGIDAHKEVIQHPESGNISIHYSVPSPYWYDWTLMIWIFLSVCTVDLLISSVCYFFNENNIHQMTGSATTSLINRDSIVSPFSIHLFASCIHFVPLSHSLFRGTTLLRCQLLRRIRIWKYLPSLWNISEVFCLEWNVFSVG